MPSITVDHPKLKNRIWFDQMLGIYLTEKVLDGGVTMAVLRKELNTFREFTSHPFFKEERGDWASHHHGGVKFPWSEKHAYTVLEFSEVVIRPWEAKAAAKTYRQSLIAKRRDSFAKQRPELLLALIHRDGPKCQHSGCWEVTDLTVDHKHPLSQGGTDALDNLQLLCRAHNSAKGARPATSEEKEFA